MMKGFKNRLTRNKSQSTNKKGDKKDKDKSEKRSSSPSSSSSTSNTAASSQSSKNLMTNSATSLKSNSPSPSRNNSSNSAVSIKSTNSNTTMTSATSPQGSPTTESPRIVVNDDNSNAVFGSPSQQSSNSSGVFPSTVSLASGPTSAANMSAANTGITPTTMPSIVTPNQGAGNVSFNSNSQPITPTPTSPKSPSFESRAHHSQQGAQSHYQLNPNISSPGRDSFDIDLISAPKRHSSSRFEPTTSERYQEINKLPNFDEVLPEDQINLFIQKIDQCNIMFDFSDPTFDIRGKEIKRMTLQELAWDENVYDIRRLTRPGNIIFLVVFAISFLWYIVILAKSRYWWFNVAFFCGAALEFLGFLGRVLSFNDMTYFPYYLLQLIVLTIAPAFIMGGIYFLLGQLVIIHGRQFSVLKPLWYAYIFIACDITSLVIQAIGGELLVCESKIMKC
ncbi:RTA1 like family protein [Candida parapsilosis]|uniref:Sphingoid long-chain base transporter RSB1 n=1 Tax=Candida parapsilosis TaxID=5480 RepID=A0A8X7NPX6_CANPA|nr:RTA1 like family protein [Candida parapsilosis]